MDYQELRKFMKPKFRVGNMSGKKDKISLLAYIDARDVMDLLDEVVGPANWESDYKEIKGNLYAGIAIDGKWKRDCGTESNTEQEKGEASDSFKRAGVKRGIGRFLYTCPNMRVPCKTYKGSDGKERFSHIDDNGKKVYDITEYAKKKFSAQLKDWIGIIDAKRIDTEAKKEAIKNDKADLPDRGKPDDK